MRRASSLQSGFLLLLGVGLVLGLAATIGWPDLPLITKALTAGNVSSDAMQAVLSLICWTVALGFGIGMGISLLRGVKATKQVHLSISRNAVLLLVVGIMIFAGGCLHNLSQEHHQCCGSLQEAEQVAR
jgi:hypothetical protein